MFSPNLAPHDRVSIWTAEGTRITCLPEHTEALEREVYQATAIKIHELIRGLQSEGKESRLNPSNLVGGYKYSISHVETEEGPHTDVFITPRITNETIRIRIDHGDTLSVQCRDVVATADGVWKRHIGDPRLHPHTPEEPAHSLHDRCRQCLPTTGHEHAAYGRGPAPGVYEPHGRPPYEAAHTGRPPEAHGYPPPTHVYGPSYSPHPPQHYQARSEHAGRYVFELLKASHERQTTARAFLENLPRYPLAGERIHTAQENIASLENIYRGINQYIDTLGEEEFPPYVSGLIGQLLETRWAIFNQVEELGRLIKSNQPLAPVLVPGAPALAPLRADRDRLDVLMGAVLEEQDRLRGERDNALRAAEEANERAKSTESQLRAEIARLTGSNEELGRDLSTTRQHLSEETARADALGQERDTLLKGKTALEGRIQSLGEQLQQAQSDLRAAYEDAAGARRDLVQTREALGAANKRAATAEAEVRRISGELEGAQRELGRLGGRLVELERALRETQERAAAEKERFQGLMDELSGVNEGLRNDIEAALEASAESARYAERKKRELKDVQYQLGVSMERITHLEQELAKSGLKITTFKERLREAEHELGQQRLRALETEEEKNRLSRDLEVSNRRRSELENMLAFQNHELTRLKAAAEEDAATLAQLRHDVFTLTEGNAELRALLEAANQRADESEGELRVARAELQRLKEQLGALEYERDGLNLRLTHVTRERDAALTRAEDAEAKLRRLQVQYDKLAEVLQERDQELLQLRPEVVRLREMAELAEARAGKAEGELQGTRLEILQLTGANEQLVRDLKQAHKAAKKSKKDIEGKKEEISQVQNQLFFTALEKGELTDKFLEEQAKATAANKRITELSALHAKQIAESREADAASRERIRALESELGEQKLRAEEGEREKGRLSRDFEESRRQMADLESTLDRQNRELEGLRADAERDAATLERLGLEVGTLTAGNEGLTNKLREAELRAGESAQQLIAARAELAELRERLRASEHERYQLTGQLASMTRERDLALGSVKEAEAEAGRFQEQYDQSVLARRGLEQQLSELMPMVDEAQVEAEEAGKRADEAKEGLRAAEAKVLGVGEENKRLLAGLERAREEAARSSEALRIQEDLTRDLQKQLLGAKEKESDLTADLESVTERLRLAELVIARQKSDAAKAEDKHRAFIAGHVLFAESLQSRIHELRAEKLHLSDALGRALARAELMPDRIQAQADEIQLLKWKIANHTKEQEDLGKELQASKEEENKLKRQLTAGRDDLQGLQEQAQRDAQDLKALQSQVHSLSAQDAKLRADLHAAEQRSSESGQQLSLAGESLRALERAHSEVQNNLAGREQELRTITEEHEQAKSALDEALGRSAILDEELQWLTEADRVANARVNELTQELGTEEGAQEILAKHLADAAVEAAELTARLKEATGELAIAVEAGEILGDRFADASREAAYVTARLKEATSELEKMRLTVLELRLKILRLTEERSEAISTRGALRIQAKGLERLVLVKRLEIAAAKRKARDARQALEAKENEVLMLREGNEGLARDLYRAREDARVSAKAVEEQEQHISGLEKQLGTLRLRNKTLLGQLGSAEGRATTAEGELGELKVSIQRDAEKTMQRVAGLEEQLHGAQSREHEVLSRLEVAEETARAAQDGLQGELDKLRGEHGKQGEQLASLILEVGQVHREVARLRERERALQAEITRLQGENLVIQGVRDQQVQALARVSEELQRVKDAASAREAALLEQQARELAASLETIVGLQDELGEIQTASAALEGRRKELADEVRRLTGIEEEAAFKAATVAQLRQELASVQEEKVRIEGEAGRTQQSLKETQEELQGARTTHRELEGALRRQLEEVRASAKEAEESARTKQETLQGSIDLLTQQYEEGKTSLSQLKARHDQHVQESERAVSGANEKSSKLEEELRTLGEASKSQEAALRATLNRATIAEANAQKLEREKAELELNHGQLSEQLTKQDQQLVAMQREVKNIAAELDAGEKAKTQQLAEQLEANAKMFTELRLKGTQVLDLQTALEAVSATQSALEKRVTESDSKLKNAEASAKRAGEESRRQLQANTELKTENLAKVKKLQDISTRHLEEVSRLRAEKEGLEAKLAAVEQFRTAARGENLRLAEKNLETAKQQLQDKEIQLAATIAQQQSVVEERERLAEANRTLERTTGEHAAKLEEFGSELARLTEQAGATRADLAVSQAAHRDAAAGLERAAEERTKLEALLRSQTTANDVAQRELQQTASARQQQDQQLGTLQEESRRLRAEASRLRAGRVEEILDRGASLGARALTKESIEKDKQVLGDLIKELTDFGLLGKKSIDFGPDLLLMTGRDIQDIQNKAIEALFLLLSLGSGSFEDVCNLAIFIANSRREFRESPLLNDLQNYLIRKVTDGLMEGQDILLYELELAVALEPGKRDKQLSYVLDNLKAEIKDINERPPLGRDEQRDVARKLLRSEKEEDALPRLRLETALEQRKGKPKEEDKPEVKPEDKHKEIGLRERLLADQEEERRFAAAESPEEAREAWLRIDMVIDSLPNDLMMQKWLANQSSYDADMETRTPPLMAGKDGTLNEVQQLFQGHARENRALPEDEEVRAAAAAGPEEELTRTKWKNVVGERIRAILSACIPSKTCSDKTTTEALLLRYVQEHGKFPDFIERALSQGDGNALKEVAQLLYYYSILSYQARPEDLVSIDQWGWLLQEEPRLYVKDLLALLKASHDRPNVLRLAKSLATTQGGGFYRCNREDVGSAIRLLKSFPKHADTTVHLYALDKNPTIPETEFQMIDSTKAVYTIPVEAGPPGNHIVIVDQPYMLDPNARFVLVDGGGKELEEIFPLIMTTEENEKIKQVGRLKKGIEQRKRKIEQQERKIEQQKQEIELRKRIEIEQQERKIEQQKQEIELRKRIEIEQQERKIEQQKQEIDRQKQDMEELPFLQAQQIRAKELKMKKDQEDIDQMLQEGGFIAEGPIKGRAFHTEVLLQEGEREQAFKNQRGSLRTAFSQFKINRDNLKAEQLDNLIKETRGMIKYLEDLQNFNDDVVPRALIIKRIRERLTAGQGLEGLEGVTEQQISVLKALNPLINNLKRLRDHAEAFRRGMR